MSRSLTFTVPGIPQPQGSSRAFVVGGRARITSDNPQLKGWRNLVAYHAAQARQETLQGPVGVHATFWLPKPKSRPKRDAWPDRKPDLDKLARGLLDGIVEASVIEDDARVVWLAVAKCWASDDRPAGCMVTVSEEGEQP